MSNREEPKVHSAVTGTLPHDHMWYNTDVDCDECFTSVYRDHLTLQPWLELGEERWAACFPCFLRLVAWAHEQEEEWPEVWGIPCE